MASKIPIKNIYYMLCYAYDILKTGENVNLSNEEFDNIYDLFGKILVNGTSLLIKRGFNREYINISEELAGIRGKIGINESIKRQSFIRGKLHCDFDELSSNILFNQIIKSSISSLIKYKKLDNEIRIQLIKINRYFHEIDTIHLNKSHFSQIRYHRNNNFYKLLIDICEMIFDELITTSQKGETDFKDFIQDKQMAKLYEKFILNFYKKEFTELTVHSPNFSWDKDVDFEHKGDDLLPIMKTDIVLQNKDKQLIIDAKYYADALISRNDIEVKKYRSFHLYQIFSYINNSKFDGEKAGMLLYPVVDNEIDAVSKIQGKEIYIQTLNLNTDWKNIERRLMEIARKSFPSLPG